jgi:sarcosine oxidase
LGSSTRSSATTASAPPSGNPIVVVGLGAVGSATLWQLARRGAKVVGLDAFEPPHDRGSSHGDSRITRLAIGEGDAYVPLARRSHEIWREVEALTGERLLQVTGGLWISSPARQAETHVANFFDNTLAAARRFGIAHETLDAAAIRRRFPQFAVRDNEAGYYEPGAGYLRPEACVRAQLALARREGAQVRTGECVTSLRESGGAVIVTTDRGELAASRVVVAAGARLHAFLAPALASAFAITRQVLYWFDVQAPLADYEAPRFPVFIWELQERRHVIYGFPAIDGPGGGLKVATEQYAHTTTADTMQRTVGDEEKRVMHAELVAPYLPGLGARCVKAAACLYTATADFHFAIGALPGHERVLLASPCSGHGFKHSAALGEALAQQVLEGRSAIDLSPFGLERL